ncbi:radical SAM protein [Sorangium sp. So ce861]|uniref:radical SAM protein n=1 Tax=Sorangium sp. So ce861 TaxID=3133323 RepID=UPI003F63E411
MTSWRGELARRMSGPQRHRLLQGYPMLPLMRPAVERSRGVLRGTLRRADGALRALGLARAPEDGEEMPGASEPAWVQLDPTRPILVGVLPHAQCNPRVEGCGFCTFPHDPYDKGLLRRTARAVAEQIDSFFQEHPELARRRVDAVYFGGATANLTPRAELAAIGEALVRNLDLRGAEVTLEGVPALFRSLLRGPFEVLLDMPARHRRISMGVQTFDEAMLTRMGRRGFGGRRDVERVVEKAHRSGLTVSGDFLINLPSQPLARMLADAGEAQALGFDQICVYHLVLAAGQGTPWAEDRAIRAELPSVEQACDSWLAVREALLQRGYVQATLTNFERADVHATDRRFVYEEHSFTPARYDAIGFGPLSISSFTDLSRRRAVKLARAKSLEAGLWGEHDLFFAYDEEDLRLLFLTRTLCRLRVPRAAYRDLFGADVVEHFGEAIEAVEAAGLATLDAEALRLTPRGMFYADSVAGLLAWRRVEALRAGGAGRRTRDLLQDKVRLNDFMG